MLNIITDLLMLAGWLLMLIALVAQEVRIGRCETALNAMGRRLSRHLSAAETGCNAHSGEVAARPDNHSGK